MKKIFTLFCFAFISYSNLLAAPGDDCATAIAVASNGCSAAGAYDNSAITGTLTAPSCFTGGNNNGMWFQFVASTRIVNITVNGGTLTQPQLALLTAPTGCGGSLTEISCISPGTAAATINYSNLTIGTTYYIYVDGRNNIVGNFQLCLTSPVAPANDNPCTPIVVPANNFCSGNDAFTNVGAANDNLFSTNIPACWVNTTNDYNTVFFQFTALGPFNTITISGSLNQPQLMVFQTGNCNGTIWTSFGASSCGSSGTNTVTVNANNLIAGQTYLIAVDGRDARTGAFQLCVNSFTPSATPPNDLCSGAVALCPNVQVSGTTVNATATNDVALSRWLCNAVLDNPVWYTFVANTPVQNVDINMTGVCNANNLQVEVFRFTGASGPCVPANNAQFTSIACTQAIVGTGSATLTVPAASLVAGQTYYILVDNWPGNNCTFTLNLTGIAGANAGADQDVCINQAPFNNTGTPAGGTWTGTGITNASTGRFDPMLAGYGTHTLFYANGACTDQKIINVSGPQVVTSNDVTICGGSTQLVGSANPYPVNLQRVFTNSTSANIPDNNTALTSTIAVSGISPNSVATNPIQRVCLNINHTWNSDLDIFLRCPGGTQIELSTDNGGSSDNYTNTCFVASGTAVTGGTGPFNGNYTPEQPFTNLNACAINGNWSLIIYDDISGDVGSLINWSIYFNTTNTINYVWSPTTNMTGSTTLNPTVTPASTTTYYLTATDNNGCVDSDSVRVTVGGSAAGPDQSVCLNTSTAFTSSGVGSWSAVPGNPAPVTIQNAGNPTSNVGPFNSTGTYRFEWVSGSCRDTVLINVNALPVANAGADQNLTCTATSFLIGSPAVAGHTYSWTPAAGLDNAGIAQPTVSAPGLYILTVTNNTTTCQKKDTVNITQTVVTPPANAGPDRTLTCTNTSFVIGSAPVAGNTYSWSPAAGLNDATIAQPTVSLPNTYTLTVTNTATSCTNTDVVIISRDTTSPATNAGPDRLLTCAVNAVSIGTPAVAGQTYSWSPAAGLSNAGIAQPTASTTGTFTLTATNTSNGCTKSDAVIVSVDTTRPAANAGTNQTITCSNTSFVIGSPAVAGNTYSWSPAAGLDNAAIAQPAASAAGTYTLTVTKTANGCTAADAVVIAVDTSRPAVNAGTDKTITCASPTHLIGSPAIAGNTYSWSPAAGLNNAAIAQPTASSTGTYTLSVTKTANGCTATDQVTVAVDTSRPVANAGTDRTITCANPTFVIGSPAIAGNTYSWSPAAGLSNPAIAQPTASTTGTYTVTVTKTANGCTASDAVVIAVDTSRPAANAGADRTLTCINPSFVIGSPAIAGNTYSWSPAAGLSNAALADPTVSTTGTYTLTVTKTANGCTASDAVVIAVDTSKPVANAGADKIITCTSPTHIIGSPAVAGNTYSWSPAAGLNNAAIAQPTASSTGTYTLTVTKTANGCTASDAVTVAVDTSRPVANAGADKIITCASPTHLIGTAAAAGNTYSWSPAAGLDDPTIARPTVSTTGTYTLTVTKTANGCTNTDAATVTIDTISPAANAGANQLLTCILTSTVIGTAPSAGHTYSWNPSSGLSNSSIAQPTANAGGTYTLTVTNTANGCSKSDAVTVNTDTVRPVANAGADKPLTCTSMATIIGTAAQAGNTYSWSPSAGLNNDAIAQPTASAAGNYTLTVTKTANGCTAADIVSVAVDTTRPVANAGTDKTLNCTITNSIIGTAAISGNTYSWSPSAGLNNNGIAEPTASTTGIYTLTVTKTSNGCTATDAVTVSVDTVRPTANAGTDKVITCANPTQTIGTAGVAGNTYSWSPSAGLNNAGSAQPVASTTGTYTVTVTRTSNGCTASDAVLISADTLRPVANAGTDKTLTCSVSSILLGSTAVSGNTYAWSPATGLDNTALAQPTTTSTGNYVLTVTKTANGCTATDAVTITQNRTPPAADAGSDKVLTCIVKNVVLGTAAIAGNTYSWSPAAGLNTTAVAQPAANTTGNYTLTVTNTANGCSSTDAVTVSVDTIRPAADAGPDQTLICLNINETEQVTLGSASLPNLSYSWLPAESVSDNSIAQPNTNIPGIYVLTVTSNSNGCKSADSVVIDSEECFCDFYVPTAFSPNSDGVNDIFLPFINCDEFSGYQLSVFNRWGELVYRTADILTGWDGFYKNESQQVDTYIWVIEYFDILRNKDILKKGTVTLLK
jgi:gliding motility-associated-like protein